MKPFVYSTNINSSIFELFIVHYTVNFVDGVVINSFFYLSFILRVSLIFFDSLHNHTIDSPCVKRRPNITRYKVQFQATSIGCRKGCKAFLNPVKANYIRRIGWTTCCRIFRSVFTSVFYFFVTIGKGTSFGKHQHILETTIKGLFMHPNFIHCPSGQHSPLYLISILIVIPSSE